MDSLLIVAVIVFLSVIIIGSCIKLYTKRKLDDIDGWRGVYKKIEFGNRINNDTKKK